MFSTSGLSLRHAHPPQLLGGGDERPPDVAVLDQPVPVGNARLPGEALGGRHAGLRHRHHHVGLGRRLAGQLLAHPLPGGVDVLGVQLGVGPGEVDELEQAELRIGLGVALRADAGSVDDDHLRRLDLPDGHRPDDVEPGRLAGQDPAPFQPAEDQRAEPVGIPDADEAGVVHQHERKGPPQAGQDPLQRPFQVATVGARLVGVLAAQQFADHVGVRPDRVPVEAELVGQLDRVRQVPVVAEGEAGVARRAVDRLGVVPGAGAGRGVADLADGQVAVQRGQAALVEDLGDEAHVLHHGDRLAVAHGDAGRLLTAVLEGEKSEVGELGDRLARRVDAEDPAGLADAIIHSPQPIRPPTALRMKSGSRPAPAGAGSAAPGR